MLQEPGEIEKDFAGHDTASIMKKFLTGRDPKPLCLPKEVGFSALKTPETLPAWLLEEDVNYFAGKFSKTGFVGGLNYYRALNLYVPTPFPLNWFSYVEYVGFLRL